MVSEKMKALGVKKSVIREIFEYAKQRKAEIGDENVFDYSIGNPSVPSPRIVNDTLTELLDNTDSVLLHGYTSAQGDFGVRSAIAEYLGKTHNIEASPDYIYMTVGAAASLTISLNALLTKDADEEVIVFAPFFPEYRVFVEKADGRLVVVAPAEADFQVDLSAFERAITEKTRAVIVNSPNTPTRVVLSEETIVSMCEILKAAEKKYGNPIYLISDEPYRELVYGDVKVPFLTKYYKNTIVCYSFSKSLSLPGERIGYIYVNPEAECADEVYSAVLGAGRALGFVCAPLLFQRLIPKCLGITSDLEIYDTNRVLLYEELTKYGYECVKPDGAFYLFVKALEKDAYAFYERAKKYELLLVPSDDFGYKGYVRIAYCVKTEQIKRSLPAFKKLAEDYKAEQKNG